MTDKPVTAADLAEALRKLLEIGALDEHFDAMEVQDAADILARYDTEASAKEQELRDAVVRAALGWYDEQGAPDFEDYDLYEAVEQLKEHREGVSA